MSCPVYVLDANVFIEAARRYYAFDIAPGFWHSLVEHARDGHLRSIDRVRDELERGQDELWKWAKEQFHARFFSTNDVSVTRHYGRIIQWASGEQQFSAAAKSVFAATDNADAWLVAYAMEENAVVVTHEGAKEDVKRRIPIPNVCEAFKVHYVDTFQMLRQLGVRWTH